VDVGEVGADREQLNPRAWSVNGQWPTASHRNDRSQRKCQASEPLRLERLEAMERGLVVFRRPPKAGVVRSNRIGGTGIAAGQTGWISGGYDRSRAVDDHCGQWMVSGETRFRTSGCLGARVRRTRLLAL